MSGKTGAFTPSVGGPRVNASSRRRQRRFASIDGGVRAKRWRGGSEAAASSAETPASTQHVYCEGLVDTPSSSSSVSSVSPAPQFLLDSCLGSSAQRCVAPAVPTPRLPHCPDRPLSIKQRKTLLIDRFEHCVSNESISSKWRLLDIHDHHGGAQRNIQNHGRKTLFYDRSHTQCLRACMFATIYARGSFPLCLLGIWY